MAQVFSRLGQNIKTFIDHTMWSWVQFIHEKIHYPLKVTYAKTTYKEGTGR